jgi:hypothetical protein
MTLYTQLPFDFDKKFKTHQAIIYYCYIFQSIYGQMISRQGDVACLGIVGELTCTSSRHDKSIMA